MREILFKNSTSQDHKRRAILVSEAVEGEGLQALSERRCVYVIKNKVHLGNPLDLINCVSHQEDNLEPGRHLFIKRAFNSNNGEKFFSWKIIGRFYIVMENDIYTIAFKHTFKILIHELKCKD